MDVSDLTLADWPALGGLGEAPEALTAALISAVATLGLILFFAPRLPIARGGAHPARRDAATCEFLINGASVKPLTEPARALLDSLAPGGPRLAALTVHLAGDCPDIQPDLEALVLYGTGFRRHCPRGDGTAFEVVGEPRGGAAFLSVRPASEEARALRETETELGRAVAEMRFMRDVLDHAPVLAWSHGPDGQVAWANAPYRDRFDPPAGDLPDHRIADGFGHVLDEVPLTARGGESRRRVAVPARDGSEPHWFELSETTGEAGETLGFALAADDLVAAEASLRRFVETLTETFAHLPIGLAVFDKSRRLGLFNPALTDLVKIDAVWLAGRPSLRDFLERLRETRQMPEQKDFASWRRKLSELEEGARSGTYEENWQLPSGKIFRVTGRPHPQGALAFLFEDISTAIMLERKYRSELELSQATLDRMSEAVAVFDASGSLVFVNSAFEALWGIDPMERLDGPGVAAMAAFWAERCAPSGAWARLTEFTTAADARTSWTETVATRDGRAVEMLVAPLPDASALVVFRDRSGGESADALAGRLAAEALREPVEALLAEARRRGARGAAGARRDWRRCTRDWRGHRRWPRSPAPTTPAAATRSRRSPRRSPPAAMRSTPRPTRRSGTRRCAAPRSRSASPSPRRRRPAHPSCWRCTRRPGSGGWARAPPPSRGATGSTASATGSPAASSRRPAASCGSPRPAGPSS